MLMTIGEIERHAADDFVKLIHCVTHTQHKNSPYSFQMASISRLETENLED